MERKTVTFNLNIEIVELFKEKCKRNEVKQNDVIAAFVNAYINGDIEIKTEYKIKTVERSK